MSESANNLNPRPGRRGWRVLSVLLGTLLLVTAGLKVHGLPFDPVARIGVFASPWFQVLVIQFELLLGLWLLLGEFRIAAWLVSLATFTVFAGFSFCSGYSGQASCGCFGTIKASPWWAFAIDSGILLSLGMFRPGWDHRARMMWRSQLSRPLLAIGGVLGILAILCGLAHWRCGSLPGAIAQLRGERVSVYPSILEFGEGQPGDWKQTIVEVSNWTDRPIRIVGGTSDCSCSTLADLPVLIRPADVRQLHVHVRLPYSTGVFTRSAMLLVDDQGLRQVPLMVTATITERSDLTTGKTNPSFEMEDQHQ